MTKYVLRCAIKPAQSVVALYEHDFSFFDREGEWFLSMFAGRNRLKIEKIVSAVGNTNRSFGRMGLRK